MSKKEQHSVAVTKNCELWELREKILRGFAWLANRNFWISGRNYIESGDPWAAVEYKHTWKSIHECQTLEELKEKFRGGNWAIGQGFMYKSLCFVNQINGGDEWYTMKYFWNEDRTDMEMLAFESISFQLVTERGGFEKLMGRLLKANFEQCKKLDY